jgi:hypothetical protein
LNEPFVPAKAGTQGHLLEFLDLSHWVPAFAGTNGADAAIQAERKNALDLRHPWRCGISALAVTGNRICISATQAISWKLKFASDFIEQRKAGRRECCEIR